MWQWYRAVRCRQVLLFQFVGNTLRRLLGIHTRYFEDHVETTNSPSLVTRKARNARRRDVEPSLLAVFIAVYSSNIALSLIRSEMKVYLLSNPVFFLFAGNPSARLQHIFVSRYFVRCLGKVPFRNSGRSCIVDALLNAAFLLLGSDKLLK